MRMQEASSERFAHGAFALPPHAGEGNGKGAIGAPVALTPTPALPRTWGRERSNIAR